MLQVLETYPKQGTKYSLFDMHTHTHTHRDTNTHRN